MAHNDYYVAIRDNDGWAVERPKADRASGLFERKWQAIRRAHELAEHGVVHVQNEKGRFVRCNCPQCRKV